MTRALVRLPLLTLPLLLLAAAKAERPVRAARAAPEAAAPARSAPVLEASALDASGLDVSALDVSAPSLLPRGLVLPHAGETRCELCHKTSGWDEVSFAHDRTGFPLRGVHERATCKSCHATGQFDDPLPRSCAACHRDPHAGELGARCESCHDEQSWASRFDAMAHRRTNFPLTGRHAVLPCQECHPGAPERTFAGNTVSCVTCHADDYGRTALASIDHAASGFSTDCRTCHDAWSWARGRFPGHDACFELSSGPHAGIACLDCHSSLRGATPSGTCNTRTAACTGCHEHSCARTAEEHEGVRGYQCKDRKCYECHRFSSGSSDLRQLLRGAP